MSKDPTAKGIAEIPANIQELLGKTLVLPNENLEAYKKLFLRIANAVAPIDVIEWLWVDDILYHTWEIRRLRLFKLKLLRISHEDVYENYCKENKLATQDELAMKKWIETSDKGTTFAFLHEQKRYERIDFLLASAEARRNGALHEIERHRQSFACRLGKASDDIIDGVFTEPHPAPAASVQGTKSSVTPASHVPGKPASTDSGQVTKSNLVKKGTQISSGQAAELLKGIGTPAGHGPKKDPA